MQEKRWLFTDDMVEKLIYFLKQSESSYGLARSEMVSGQCATCKTYFVYERLLVAYAFHADLR